jgi:hypothetical protein
VVDAGPGGGVDRDNASVAGLCCCRPGEPSRLIYRALLYRGGQGQPKGFREPDLIALMDAAHQQGASPWLESLRVQ